MLDKLTLQDFTPRIGDAFRVAAVEGLSLTLFRATSLAGKMGALAPEKREPFDLMFVGPLNPVLPQRIYRLESDGAEPLEIFIVPIGPFEGGIGYQAIFA